MKKFKHLFIIFLLATGISANGQTFVKAVAVKITDSFDIRLDQYVSKYNHDLVRNKFLDYCAFERANYFVSILEKTAKVKGITLWECGQNVPRGSQARKAHKELFGNPDFFIESDVPFVKAIRDFEDQNLMIQSEIMVPLRWQGKFSKRKGLIEVTKKAMLWHSVKTGSVTGDILETYKESKAHHDAIIEDGNGDYGLSTVTLIQETKNEDNTWTYDIVIYNLVVFSKPIRQLSQAQ